MTSKIKVDNINKVSDDSNIINKCGTSITMGQNGDTVIIPNGVTEQIQSGGDIQVQSGGQITIASGATITNNGTQVGFGREGTVNWDTTPKTATFTAVSGTGYFANTTGGAFTMNLPAGAAGSIVSVADYAENWATFNLTLAPNGAEKIGGVSDTVVLDTKGQSVTLVYVDAVQGWINTMDSTSNVRALDVYNVQYLVVAGGGGGGTTYGGGGGAGGYRTIASKTFSVQAGNSFPIDIGAGGGGAPTPAGPEKGLQGGNSVFSTIISTGGGGGVGGSPGVGPAGPGGSGGGGGKTPSAPSYSGEGAGNTPPVSPPQGFPGADASIPAGTGGGGGGASIKGGPGRGGGTGSPTDIMGSIPQAPSYGTPGPSPGRYFSGGGAGYNNANGGAGGGGSSPNDAGCTNTGGGGSACAQGGPGIVIIRHITADGSPTNAGGNVTATCGADTVRIFTGPGTFVA